MNIDELTIKQVKELTSFIAPINSVALHGAVGKKCVVRTYASGVHFGEVVSVASNDGRSRCELRNSRRIWSWDGAFTLSAVATAGINKADSKVSVVTKAHFIEDAIEFIPATQEAVDCIESMTAHE